MKKPQAPETKEIIKLQLSIPSKNEAYLILDEDGTVLDNTTSVLDANRIAKDHVEELRDEGADELEGSMILVYQLVSYVVCPKMPEVEVRSYTPGDKP